MVVILRVPNPCPVCTVFDTAIGHCRVIRHDFWPDGVPKSVLKKVFSCTADERRFYRGLGRSICHHGRRLS